MDAPGWYRDPEHAGCERWWDGEAWTIGQRWAPPPLDEEIHIPARTGDLVSAGERLTLGDKVLSLSGLDAIAYWWTARRTQGVYTGHFFSIKCKQGDDKGHWAHSTGSKDKDVDLYRTGYEQMVARLETTVAPRLTEELVARIRAGETLTLHGIVVDAAGVKPRRPLAKTIPWADVAGTQRELQYLRVLVRREGADKDKKKLLLGPDQWNIVLLPRIVFALAPALN